MVNYCILCKVCTTTTSALSFHRFPKDKDRRSKWLQAINMNQVPQCAHLCSNHFKSSDYQETIYGLRSSLKKTAIPRITSQEINCDANIATSSEKFHTEIQNTYKEQSEIKEECSMECNDATKDNPNSLKRKSMENEEVDFPLKHIKYRKDININEVSRNPDEAAMVLEIAQETITEQAKKIQRLQINIYKLKKRVQSLTELNKHLHDNNLISNKALEHMNSAAPVVKSIIQKLLSQHHTFRTFPPELQNFAASLYFYSPKAYEYVRETFMKILPHQSTIRSWYTNVDDNPGICKPALQCFKKKGNLVEKTTREYNLNVMSRVSVLQRQTDNGRLGYHLLRREGEYRSTAGGSADVEERGLQLGLLSTDHQQLSVRRLQPRRQGRMSRNPSGF